jgi:hypothetical protein
MYSPCHVFVIFSHEHEEKPRHCSSFSETVPKKTVAASNPSPIETLTEEQTQEEENMEHTQEQDKSNK